MKGVSEFEMNYKVSINIFADVDGKPTPFAAPVRWNVLGSDLKAVREYARSIAPDMIKAHKLADQKVYVFIEIDKDDVHYRTERRRGAIVDGKFVWRR